MKLLNYKNIFMLYSLQLIKLFVKCRKIGKMLCNPQYEVHVTNVVRTKSTEILMQFRVVTQFVAKIFNIPYFTIDCTVGVSLNVL